MSTPRFIIVALGALALPAQAGEVTVDMALDVPLVCRVEPVSAPSRSGDVVTIPAVRELCNGRGHDLFLQYDAGTLDGAVVRYAGAVVTLDGSGEVRIARRPGAVARTSALVIEGVPETAEGLAIGFRVSPV